MMDDDRSVKDGLSIENTEKLFTEVKNCYVSIRQVDDGLLALIGAIVQRVY